MRMARRESPEGHDVGVRVIDCDVVFDRQAPTKGGDGAVFLFQQLTQGSFAMIALARATTSALMASAVLPDGTLT